MALTFGILSSFDHNTQDWKTYKSRLSQWFIANEISVQNDSKGAKRRAVLLSALSDSTFKLAADLALPKKLQDISYEGIVELLDGHFTPKRCGFSERYKFYAAVQLPGEGHAQWAARLRGLTAHCGFSDIEEALRDRFVMGMAACPEREKLFGQNLEALTLAKAVELAESVRCARAGAADASAPPPQALFQIHSNNSSRSGNRTAKDKCAVCGRNNHVSSQCRFKNYKCKKCNNKGHLRKMCKNLNYVETDNVGEDDDDGKLFNIRSERGEPLAETVLINNARLTFQIDSGSAVTVISEDIYRSHFSDVPLSPTNKNLITYTGDSIACAGRVRLRVTYMQRSRDLDVYVVRGGGPPLLGRDFLSSFKLQLSPCHYVNSHDIVSDLQRQYPNVFSDKLGTFTKYKVKLRLKENCKPIFCKARPLAFALRDKIDKEIERLVNLGVLEPIEH